jgi:predicted RNase H-like HicB family nuclease
MEMKTKATTAEYYPVIVEQETNGTWSAYVAGFPGVYAAADTATDAKRAIRGALAAHLEALQTRHVRATKSKMQLLVLRYKNRGLQYAGLGSLLGRKTSAAKARAARENGRKGGRPSLHT